MGAILIQTTTGAPPSDGAVAAQQGWAGQGKKATEWLLSPWCLTSLQGHIRVQGVAYGIDCPFSSAELFARAGQTCTGNFTQVFKREGFLKLNPQLVRI